MGLILEIRLYSFRKIQDGPKGTRGEQITLNLKHLYLEINF